MHFSEKKFAPVLRKSGKIVFFLEFCAHCYEKVEKIVFFLEFCARATIDVEKIAGAISFYYESEPFDRALAFAPE